MIYQFTVYCDAAAGGSDSNGMKLHGGLGVILAQTWEDGKERVVGYASRKLRGHEENYSAYLLELLAKTFAVSHFRHYLYGQKKFIIHSDHKPLLCLNKVQTKTRHRLQEIMDDYNFEIKYRKGSEQEAADCLSRNAIDMVEELDVHELGTNQIRTLQSETEYYKPIKDYLQHGTELPKSMYAYRAISKQLPGMRIDEDGILWTTGKENTPLLVLPPNFVQRTISNAHESMIGGHRDIVKTLHRIQRVYWWPGILKDINDFLKSCDTCQRIKGPRDRKTLNYPLKPLELPQRFNERVHADLMGPLLSNGSNKYLLVMSDSFTKWIELIPIPDKRAETISSAIYKGWICRNSAMEILLTDNGTEFKNETMEDLCAEFKVEHRFTSPYHAQTNAQCERQNRTIIQYLQSFLKKSTLEWEELIPSCQISYNTQVHNSTKRSPFFLRHMIDPTLPFKRLREPELRYGETWTQEAMMKLQHVWKETHEHLTKARNDQVYQHNKRAVHREFKIGDLVMVLNNKGIRGQNNKLLPTWNGPFLIFEMLSDSNALIKRTPRSRTFNIHVNRLKQYNPMETTEEDGYLNKIYNETDDTTLMENDAIPKILPDKVIGDEDDEQDEARAMTSDDHTDDEEEFSTPVTSPLKQQQRKYTSPKDRESHVSKWAEWAKDNLSAKRFTRSQGTADEQPLPKRPAEYKEYKKRRNKSK